MPKEDNIGAPMYLFQIDLIDGTGSTTALISGDVAEKLLSKTADDIFQTTCVKRQLLCVKHAQEMLSDRLFRIQLRKASWISSNVAQSNLTILSYMEKESASPLNANERNSKQARSMGHSELEMAGATGEKETSVSGLSSKPPSAPQNM